MYVAALLLLAALAVRVGEVERTTYRPINDAQSYLLLASYVARNGDYPPHGPGAGGTRGPSAYFPPGYPYFLAAVEVLDGHRGVGEASVRPARIAQALLGTTAVALVGLVASELFGSTIGLIALAIAAGYPVMIELSGVLVAENLIVPLELAAVWAALRGRRARRPYPWIAAAGILCGLATLTHENGIVLVLPLATAVWRLARSSASPHPRFPAAALAAPVLLIAAALLTIAPWTIRNATVLHSFIPISDETGITLAGTYNAVSAADPHVPYRWRLYSDIPSDRSLVRESAALTEPELDHRLLSQALRYIGAHPLALFTHAFDETRRLLEVQGAFAWRSSAYSIGISRRTAAIGVLGFWLLCVLALIGAFTRTVRGTPCWVWLVPLLFALSAVLVNSETPRFRAPVDPFLILLAACAVRPLVPRLIALRAPLHGSPIRRDRGPVAAARAAELVEVVQRLT